jgi:hypothetical protein
MVTKSECADVVNARANLAPLECRTVIEPLERDFLLTDVVFEVYDHPNGDHSRACGFVWNALSGHWSRRLIGGNVDDAGRQYHFETGLLCPRGSQLSVCTCLFVSQPTSRLWAALSGHFCRESRHDHHDLATQSLVEIDWTDQQPSAVITGFDPVGAGAPSQDVDRSLTDRTLLGTSRSPSDRGELWIEGSEGRAHIAQGTTTAIRLSEPRALWSHGGDTATAHLPEGTNLVVVRRSVDGRSLHWLCYREEQVGGVQDAQE